RRRRARRARVDARGRPCAADQPGNPRSPVRAVHARRADLRDPRDRSSHGHRLALVIGSVLRSDLADRSHKESRCLSSPAMLPSTHYDDRARIQRAHVIHIWMRTLVVLVVLTGVWPSPSAQSPSAHAPTAAPAASIGTKPLSHDAYDSWKS